MISQGLCFGFLEKKIDELTRDNAILAYKTNAIGPAVVAKVQLISQEFSMFISA